MAFQRVPNTAQIDIVFSLQSIILQNSFYAQMPTPYTITDLEALAADIDMAVPVTWLPRLPTDCTYLRTDVRGLNAENDLVASDNANTGTGDEAIQPLPNNVTFSIKKSSGLTGRSARGRTYWPSIPRDKMVAANENTLIATYITDIVLAVDSIRTNTNGVGTWQAVLVSRFLNKVKRAEGVTFPWTGTTFVNNIIDTQRGRLPK